MLGRGSGSLFIGGRRGRPGTAAVTRVPASRSFGSSSGGAEQHPEGSRRGGEGSGVLRKDRGRRRQQGRRHRRVTGMTVAAAAIAVACGGGIWRGRDL
jgi:hypothetical protein